jgi:hypothetical protein
LTPETQPSAVLTIQGTIKAHRHEDVDEDDLRSTVESTSYVAVNLKGAT